jgi:hypothetical protein
LFAALRDKQHTRIQLRRAENLKRAHEGDVLAVIATMVKKYSTFALRNPEIFRFLRESLWADASSKIEHVPHFEQEEIEYFAELIAIGIERGVMVERDPTLAALMVGGMLNGALSVALLPGTTYEALFEQIKEEIVQTVMTYLTGQSNTYDFT